MKKLALAMVLVILTITSVYATTAVTSLYGVTITNLNADYDSGATPIKIWSIKFYPSAITDTAVIKLSSGTGQTITKLMNATSLDPVIEYFPSEFRARIVYDHSASSISNSANAMIVILYRR